MKKEVILKADNIVKYFYDPVEFNALKDVSLDIYQGDLTTLVGKSGCGKSTLLYILSTLDTDYQGQLQIQGESTADRSQDYLANLRNKKIGFIFQFHYLLPEFTCLKNIMIPALKLGALSRDEIEAKAMDKLSMLNLKDQALKPVSKLSGGQQQRVAIARALINEPAIIMADEPTGNLDSKTARSVFNIFQQLTQEFNQSILAVTHDVDFARNSDRTIELKDGAVI